MTTVSPAPRPRQGQGDRGAAVDLHLELGALPGGPGRDFGDDRRRVLGAWVVGGDHGEVGELPPARPIFGRLSRSRSPPAPKTAISRPPVSRRAARSTFSIESGVCA